MLLINETLWLRENHVPGEREEYSTGMYALSGLFI